MQDHSEQSPIFRKRGIPVFDPGEEVKKTPVREGEIFDSKEIPFGGMGSVTLSFLRVTGEHKDTFPTPDSDVDVIAIDEAGRRSIKKTSEVQNDSEYFWCYAHFKPSKHLTHFEGMETMCNLWLEGQDEELRSVITYDDEGDIEGDIRSVRASDWKLSVEDKGHSLYIKDAPAILNSLRISVNAVSDLPGRGGEATE